MQKVKGAINKRHRAYLIYLCCIIVFFVTIIGEVSLAAMGSFPDSGKGRRTSKKRQNQEPESQRQSRQRISSDLNILQPNAGEKKAFRASRIKKQAAENIEPVEIQSGFVLSEGFYISPPYVVRSRQGRIFVNDIEVRDGNRPQVNRRFMGMRSMNPMFSRQLGTHIEEHLRRSSGR